MMMTKLSRNSSICVYNLLLGPKSSGYAQNNLLWHRFWKCPHLLSTQIHQKQKTEFKKILSWEINFSTKTVHGANTTENICFSKRRDIMCQPKSVILCCFHTNSYINVRVPCTRRWFMLVWGHHHFIQRSKHQGVCGSFPGFC